MTRSADRPTLSRRSMLGTLAGTAALGATLPLGRWARAAELKGRIRQSVCLWCYGGFLKQAKMNLDQFRRRLCETGPEVDRAHRPRPVADAEEARPDLRDDSQPLASPRASIASRTTRSASPRSSKGIDDTAAAGFPNVICFSGNRAGMDDQEGLANSIAGLKKIAGYAEKKKVTVCLEFLNSAHDHKDYMADSTKWCVRLGPAASARRGSRCSTTSTTPA